MPNLQFDLKIPEGEETRFVDGFSRIPWVIFGGDMREGMIVRPEREHSTAGLFQFTIQDSRLFVQVIECESSRDDIIDGFQEAIERILSPAGAEDLRLCPASL